MVAQEDWTLNGYSEHRANVDNGIVGKLVSLSPSILYIQCLMSEVCIILRKNEFYSTFSLLVT